MKMKKYTAFLLIFVICFSLCSCMDVSITSSDTGATSTTAGTSGGYSEALPDSTVTTNGYVPDTSAPVQSEPQSTEKAESETEKTQTDPVNMTKNELLEYFNGNLNAIKSDFPGFKRAKQTKVSDIVLSNSLANTVVGFVKSALLSEDVEEKTAEKGQSNMELMSPDGERYVSQLNSSDIQDISVKKQGENYLVTLTLPDAVNPDKESGAYAKIFNFVTVDDVVNTYAPKVGATVERKNIKVSYSGCYAKALFAPDGKVISYETYVTCVMSLIDASIKKGITINTDVDITLASTTNFTDFSY